MRTLRLADSSSDDGADLDMLFTNGERGDLSHFASVEASSTGASTRRDEIDTSDPFMTRYPLDYSGPAPHPRSPTVSAFSIPVSGRDSTTYSSTAHLALRPTVSAGSSAFAMIVPQSRPVHRERRRLRKKSRPLDGNIIELEDRADIPYPVTAPLPRTVSPEPNHLEPLPVVSNFIENIDPSPPPQPAAAKAPLFGFIKNWAVRKRSVSATSVSHAQAAESNRTAHPPPSHAFAPTAFKPTPTRLFRPNGLLRRATGGNRQNV
ncbi:hypothetical protein BD410DRAFT_779507 [Rickenella mellea]|uniref:Uncharacterized protein n=1 Tax=Rickenella mellea TaxID=50990 RepID=A0A4R5XDP5_9AGAM|nr:hypothetical protein BD410DRAFT_779507 [Rickenella mellea]